MALNVLSWLCDGQQKDMQDILRDEKTFSVCVMIKIFDLLCHCRVLILSAKLPFYSMELQNI